MVSDFSFELLMSVKVIDAILCFLQQKKSVRMLIACVSGSALEFKMIITACQLLCLLPPMYLKPRCLYHIQSTNPMVFVFSSKFTLIITLPLRRAWPLQTVSTTFLHWVGIMKLFPLCACSIANNDDGGSMLTLNRSMLFPDTETRLWYYRSWTIFAKPETLRFDLFPRWNGLENQVEARDRGFGFCCGAYSRTVLTNVLYVADHHLRCCFLSFTV